MNPSTQDLNTCRSSYQEGSFERRARHKGRSDVWVYRWRERDIKGKNVQKRKVIGTVDRLPTLADAKKATENLRAEINARQENLGKMTVSEAWGHFQEHELRNPVINRSETTIVGYRDYFQNCIIPDLGRLYLAEIKAVKIEAWLARLTQHDGKTPLAPGTKAKIRNHLSALFAHLIRWELYDKTNPITSVRQSAKRQKTPEILDLKEIAGTLLNIGPEVIRVMMAVAAGSALRRSEVRGLKWKDLDFENLWFNLERGMVRKIETHMKTETSRKGIPMLPELASLLTEWRKHTSYPRDDDWVFASPFTEGKRPYWAESALTDHIRPAALKAGVNKHFGWHTLRHSLGTLLNASGENIKTIQELLRHANSRITLEFYVQSDKETKRKALANMSGIFVVPQLKKAS